MFKCKNENCTNEVEVEGTMCAECLAHAPMTEETKTAVEPVAEELNAPASEMPASGDEAVA